MPRRTRPDIFPLIDLSTDDDVKDIFNKVTIYNPFLRKKGKELTLKSIAKWSETAGYYIAYGEALRERLDGMREKSRNIDARLLNELFLRIPIADARPAVKKNGAPVLNAAGKQMHELRKVGCRVEFGTLHELASDLHIPISTLNERLKWMREEMIIVNGGHGWFEFAADIVWRGKSDLRSAYLQVQQPRDDQSFIDNNENIVGAVDSETEVD